MLLELVPLIRLPGQQSCRTAFTFPRCARILLQRTWSSGSGKMAGSTLRLRKLEIGQTSALESALPRWPKQIWNFKFGILLICSCSQQQQQLRLQLQRRTTTTSRETMMMMTDALKSDIASGGPEKRVTILQHATAICCIATKLQTQRCAKISQ